MLGKKIGSQLGEKMRFDVATAKTNTALMVFGLILTFLLLELDKGTARCGYRCSRRR